MPRAKPSPLVFLLDVDNTLLDNDAVTADLRRHLDKTMGGARRDLYFRLFEKLRGELGYADYLGALQRFRSALPHDPRVVEVTRFLLGYPFPRRLFPRSLAALKALRRHGQTVILTDGDVVFQPLKIARSGIGRAVADRVLIYVHKERELRDVERRFPAAHYVLIDDKLRILDAVKRQWGRRVTTVFPRQGHYALDPGILRKYPPADVELAKIGDLLALCRADFPWRAAASGK